MQQFHANMAAIQNVLCNICWECFPSISSDIPGLCNRCRADSDVPKLYSAANNMDPGQVPPELSVSYLDVINVLSLSVPF